MRAAPGARLLLRAPQESDRQELLAAARRSAALHHPWVSPPTTDSAFDEALRRWEREDVCGFLACRRDDGVVLGVWTLSQIFLGAFRSAYLGFHLFTPHTGQGYATEALHLVVAEAFDTLGLHRVEANVQPGNLASLALVHRVGFRQEGFSPRYLHLGGEWRDHERWALLADNRR